MDQAWRNKLEDSLKDVKEGVDFKDSLINSFIYILNEKNRYKNSKIILDTDMTKKLHDPQ